jgi:hypothetical protein
MNNFDGKQKKEWKMPEVICLDVSNKTEGKIYTTSTEVSDNSGTAS